MGVPGAVALVRGRCIYGTRQTGPASLRWLGTGQRARVAPYYGRTLGNGFRVFRLGCLVLAGSLLGLHLAYSVKQFADRLHDFALVYSWVSAAVFVKCPAECQYQGVCTPLAPA